MSDRYYPSIAAMVLLYGQMPHGAYITQPKQGIECDFDLLNALLISKELYENMKGGSEILVEIKQVFSGQ